MVQSTTTRDSERGRGAARQWWRPLGDKHALLDTHQLQQRPCGTTPSGGQGYTYNANGDLTARTDGFSAAYNPRGQNDSVTHPSQSAKAMSYGHLDNTYAYDAWGMTFPRFFGRGGCGDHAAVAAGVWARS